MKWAVVVRKLTLGQHSFDILVAKIGSDLPKGKFVRRVVASVVTGILDMLLGRIVYLATQRKRSRLRSRSKPNRFDPDWRYNTRRVTTYSFLPPSLV
jgi:hypothetical protein